MRISHVVTYVSEDGAFGGPVRVAQEQARALADRGHEVTIFAAAPVSAPEMGQQDGYRFALFPERRVSRRLGFAGMYGRGLVEAVTRATEETDVFHVHLARDLVTLPASRAIRKSGRPLFIQPHGMIGQSSHLLALPVDRWETRKSLRSAVEVLALTSDEEQELATVEPLANVRRISNGTRVGVLPSYEAREPTVLFLARLHPRKRPVSFVRMADRVGQLHPEATFVIAGPDEGEGEAVEREMEKTSLGERIKWIGAVAPDITGDLIQRAKVFVLPSVGEVFPMSLLEAFREGTPSVVTKSLGIATEVDRYGAAIVSDEDEESLASAVLEILEHDDRADALRQGGHALLRASLDIKRVAEDLEHKYELAVGLS